jgi:predicted RNA polymerase sigma factor
LAEEIVPQSPSAWLFTVARRRAIDQFRRDARYREKLALLEQPQEQQPDDRLQLIFTCCHPALSQEAQVALTLRTVCGLTTHEIAGAFLVSEPTIAQRLVRARRKISQARIPYKVPEDDEVNDRLNQVLAVLYLLFNGGYLSSTGELPERHDLTWMPSGWQGYSYDSCRPNRSH